MHWFTDKRTEKNNIHICANQIYLSNNNDNSHNDTMQRYIYTNIITTRKKIVYSYQMLGIIYIKQPYKEESYAKVKKNY